MTEKRFQIFGNAVEDTMGIIPTISFPFDEQKQKYCDELNKMHEENKQLKKIVNEHQFNQALGRREYDRLMMENNPSWE